MLKINVKNQSLLVAADETVSDSVLYLVADFAFSSDWNGFSKTVIFKNGETAVSVILNGDSSLCCGENKCYVPFEVIKTPELTVSVLGTNGEQTITTAAVSVSVKESGYTQGDTPREPTPDEYAQILAVATEAKDMVSALSAEELKGEKGDTGPKGEKGDKGDQGIQGPKGDKGDIGATGPKGEKGEKGTKGDTGEKGEKGDVGQDGAKGDKGDTGENGRGIVSIEKGPTSGLTDFYQITYTDGTTSSFSVTNGAKGSQGTNGVSPQIFIAYIEDDNGNQIATEVSITDFKGTHTFTIENGTDGQDGKSAYSYALDSGFEGTEAEFSARLAEDYSSEIAEINELLSPLKSESINIFDNSNVTLGKFRNYNVGRDITEILDNASWWCSNQVWSCKQGDVIRCSANWNEQVLVYDENNKCLEILAVQSSKQVTVTAANAAKFTLQSSSQGDSHLKNLMVTLNNPMPATYTPYVESDIKLEQIGENRQAIKALQDGKPYFKKPFVVLSFDNFHLNDNRFNIVQGEYGYKATVSHRTSTDAATNKQVLAAGWDIGLYKLDGSPAATDYDAAVSETPTAEMLTAWEAYVKSAVDEAAAAGVYNPTAWLSRQGCSCYGLESALKKYGIPMCRGSYNPTYSNDWDYSAEELPTMTVQCKQTLTPATLDASKADIATAIANGKGISFITHGIYATDAEANNGYGVTESCLREFLDYIKGFVDNGELEVLTYRDIYAKYYPEKARELDYNRTIKMITEV